MDELKRINNIVETTNAVDFRIQSYDGASLMLIASFDFSYYHEVELLFYEVSYISLPTSFSYPKFRKATPDEISDIKKILEVDAEETLFCIEAETSSSCEKIPFFIVAKRIALNEGLVFYYERQDLKEGERIAPWVKTNNENL